MTRSYAILSAGLLLLGLVLVGVSRLHRPESPRPTPAAGASLEAISITIGPRGVSPSPVVVPVNARVRLHAVNRGPSAVRLTLAGYEDRMETVRLRPAEEADREFVADRPGEDFPWVVNGEPQGRFVVSGSHLLEGHR